ncbi:MAG TPA: hypothetical protein VF142_07950 [Longimicrobium sp.]
MDDTELMLWALAHGWSVEMFTGEPHGSLWRDPARRRFLVHGSGASHELPVLSDEVRARIVQARAAAQRPAPQPAA